MAKLSSVVRHEYLTIVKQPSFWIAMIAIPVLIAVVIAISIIGNKASSDKIEELAKDLKNVVIVDQSGLVNAQVVAGAGLTMKPASEINALRESVRLGQQEALVVYPTTLTKDRTYQIYLSGNDLTKMGGVSTLADNLLKTSVFLPLKSPEIIAIAQSGATSQITSYKDGEETAGFNEYIAPAIFVLLFYIIFAFSVSYMLTSVSEEKENRSMEMVLTYVKPRTLIIGKLLGVSLVTLTQIAFFAVLAVIGFIILNNVNGGVAMPLGIEPSRIVFDFWPIFFGFSFLVVGFLMFAGYMTATAAAAPSSKEANNFSAVFFMGAFVPFYFIMLLVTNPENPVVKFLTFFPLTSPVVALVRNTVGNMSLLESWLALIAMIIFMIISIWIAVKAFRLGALEFGSTIKLSKLFKK
ncbi:MAG TPA: ABC transporter permease [Candidatus Saccharibacteria bacterium]|nr:ABC transporter permease [Candidatus Saccharibacteria bacterium]